MEAGQRAAQPIALNFMADDKGLRALEARGPAPQGRSERLARSSRTVALKSHLLKAFFNSSP